MTRGAVVLRPEPGNGRTAARVRAAGLDVLQLPLFAVVPVAWTLPAGEFDALLLTSANAVRHAGKGLGAVATLPVVAVGDATAEVARAAGFTVVAVGNGDAADAVALARGRGFDRLLHPTGRDRIAILDDAVTAVTVYASDALPIARGAMQACEGRIALLHSTRAAHRFATLVDRDAVDRGGIAILGLSAAVRDAAGPGWAHAEFAHAPTDAALVARAIDRGPVAGDKRP